MGLTCVGARGRRPADDGRGRSGAPTDERAVDGRDAAWRRWAHGRRGGPAKKGHQGLTGVIVVAVLLFWSELFGSPGRPVAGRLV